MPRVVSMADEYIIVLRRPHAWTVRPHQWHLLEEVIPQRKNFEEGVSPDMTEGMVAATTFNAFHQISWLHLCVEDP